MGEDAAPGADQDQGEERSRKTRTSSSGRKELSKIESTRRRRPCNVLTGELLLFVYLFVRCLFFFFFFPVVWVSDSFNITNALVLKIVLPQLLEQVVNCKDVVAQQYLLECITQVFPDEFHLQTLETVLSTLPNVQPNVDITAAISGMIERLSNFVSRSHSNLPQDIPVFDIFYNHSVTMIEVCIIGASMFLTCLFFRSDPI